MMENIWMQIKGRRNRSGTTAVVSYPDGNITEESERVYTLVQRQGAVVKGGLDETVAESLKEGVSWFFCFAFVYGFTVFKLLQT